MTNMMIEERLAEEFLIPVVVLEDADSAVDIANALLAGGIRIMEITLRTDAGMLSIGNVAKSCPEMLVGGGTVISLNQCMEAVSRGAAFIVSPGYNPEIVEYCKKNNVPVFPGCVTPTEITAAVNAGINVVKFFPANFFGGAGAIKALSGPFPQVKFIPTGGIDERNMAEYVIPQVFAIGGGWLCDRKAVMDGDYDAITRRCSQSLIALQKLKA